MGPYLVKLTNNTWLMFNSVASLCEVINLEKANEHFQFVTSTCSF